MATTATCVRGCTTRAHRSHCTTTGCRGCRPRPAAFDLAVCERCDTRIREGLRELPTLWGDLLTPTRSGGRGRRAGIASEMPAPLPDQQGAQRHAIRAMLVTWSQVITEDYALPWPDGTEDTIRNLAARVLRHTGKLLAGEHALQLADEVIDAVRDGRRYAYPSRPDWAVIGLHPCADPGGIVRARASTGMATCDTCEIEQTIDWWRTAIPSAEDDLLTDAEAAVWLSLVYGRPLTAKTIRGWFQGRPQGRPPHLERSATVMGKQATARRCDLRRHAEQLYGVMPLPA